MIASISHTNLGSGIEVGFINALVNTYGYNYNVDKVAVYVKVNSTKINEALCQMATFL